jgi:hypothetical protein
MIQSKRKLQSEQRFLITYDCNQTVPDCVAQAMASYEIMDARIFAFLQTDHVRPLCEAIRCIIQEDNIGTLINFNENATVLNALGIVALQEQVRCIGHLFTLDKITQLVLKPTIGKIVLSSSLEVLPFSPEHSERLYAGDDVTYGGGIETIPSDLSFFIAPPQKQKGINAYVGIPVLEETLPFNADFWDVCYPHITVIPPNGNPHKWITLIGQICSYKLSSVLATTNTLAHDALMSGDHFHVTRQVRHGFKPLVAKEEMKLVNFSNVEYTEKTGYPVFM